MNEKPEDIVFKLCEHLSDRPDSVVEIALAAQAAVLKFVPNCKQLIYNSYAVSNVFTFSGKLGQAFIHIATYENHVNLGFNRGTLLDDPSKMLNGTGKLIRHIRLESKDTIKKKEVTKLIQLAIEQGRELVEND